MEVTDSLLWRTGYFHVVNRPPPVIAGVIQSECQDNGRRPRGIFQIDGDGLVS